MLLDLNDIGRDRLAFDRELRLAPLEGAGGERVEVRSVRLHGEAAAGERGIDFRARLTGELSLPCSRCLAPFRLDVDCDLVRTLVPAGPDGGSDLPEADEDDTLQPISGGKVDLAALAEEQLYLSLPLKPICTPGCKGLCPNCGADRNTGTCSCATETVDPRLAPLLQFKRQRSQSTPPRG